MECTLFIGVVAFLLLHKTEHHCDVKHGILMGVCRSLWGLAFSSTPDIPIDVYAQVGR